MADSGRPWDVCVTALTAGDVVVMVVCVYPPPSRQLETCIDHSLDSLYELHIAHFNVRIAATRSSQVCKCIYIYIYIHS